MGSGRPQLEPWHLGSIVAKAHPTMTGKWQARGKYRDDDGKRHDVTASGDSEAKARRALQRKVEQHRTEHRGGDATLNHDTTVLKAAHVWLEYTTRKRGRNGKPLAPRSLEQYEGNVRRYIAGSSIATRKLDKANNVSVIEDWLGRIADAHGVGAATSARKVLSGTLALAERRGAIAASVMARVETPSASAGSTGDRKCSDPDCDMDCGKRHLNTRRALTPDEAAALFAIVDERDTADVGDLLHFLFGTGARIREALHCVSWADVNLEARTVRVRGTKTASADRTVNLSDELAARLNRRAETHGNTGLVFGVTRYDTKLGQARDVSNVLGAIKRVLDKAGLQWAGSHTFRRTVATWMDESGAPLAEIANQLGHADVSVTTKYLGRKHTATRAASVMVLPESEPPTLSVVNGGVK